MLRKLYYTLPAGMLLCCLAACGGMAGKGAAPGVTDSRQHLVTAVTMIRAGKESEARHHLELVISNSSEEGVTDEALFRLAILKLNDGETAGGKSAAALLDTLRRSYPASVWTRQAAPLLVYAAGVKHNRNRDKEINALQDKNLSLSREVRELRQIIDRLKALDSELDQKIRR